MAEYLLVVGFATEDQLTPEQVSVYQHNLPKALKRIHEGKDCSPIVRIDQVIIEPQAGAHPG